MRPDRVDAVEMGHRLLSESRSKGLRHGREVNRAHVLAALDEKVPDTLICSGPWDGSHGDLA